MAWAFMKMVGSDNKSNHGAKVRLQLYQYRNSIKSKGKSRTNPLIPDVIIFISFYLKTLHTIDILTKFILIINDSNHDLTQVYYHYKSEKRKPYPSTIYITIKSASMSDGSGWDVYKDLSVNISSPSPLNNTFSRGGNMNTNGRTQNLNGAITMKRSSETGDFHRIIIFQSGIGS